MKETDQQNMADDVAMIKQLMQQTNMQSDDVSMQAQTRLAKARQQAVEYHAQVTAGEVGISGNSMHWAGGLMSVFRQPKTLLLALILLLITMLVVQQYSHQQQLEKSDATLLAADLPPEAFADKGFNQWMELVAQ